MHIYWVGQWETPQGLREGPSLPPCPPHPPPGEAAAPPFGQEGRIF